MERGFMNYITQSKRKANFAHTKASPTPFSLVTQPREFKYFKERKNIGALFQATSLFSLPIPLFEPRAQAGVPAPIEQFTEGTLDLNEHLIKHKTATFFVRVAGESMIGAAIFPGDLLIVDRAITPTSGKIIVALLNGGLTVKRLFIDKEITILCAENDNYSDIIISEDDDFSIWGVVINVIHYLE